MLSRTVSRTGTPTGKRRWRPLASALAAVAALVGLYLLLPKPGPRVQRVDLSDDELKALVGTLHATRVPEPTVQDKALAALGRRIFHDPGFSAGGALSCASCHTPGKDYSDGLPTAASLMPLAKNTPSLVNSYLNTWFGWDGHADSLAAEALAAFEDPRQHGISRLHVVNRLRTHYAKDYEELFGRWPEALGSSLPAEGLPPPPPLKLTVAVSADALATLGRFELLDDILKTAQGARLAPAMELSRRAFARPPAGGKDAAQWTAAYAAMSPEARAAADQAFANTGRALAAFIRGLAAVDAPFDRFAQRLAEGKPVKEALDTGFGTAELTGLKLFAGPGHCTNCHAGPDFTDQQFHNLGLAQRGDQVDVGRSTGALRALADPFNCHGPYLTEAPGQESESCKELPYLATDGLELIGAFKTPSLRNVGRTAPYMHDGRFPTLAAVLDYYDELSDRPATGHRDSVLKPLGFTLEEKTALAAFLGSLTSPVRDYGLAEVSTLSPEKR